MSLPSAPLPYGVPWPGDLGTPRPRRWLVFAGVAVAAIVALGVVVWFLLSRPGGYYGAGFPVGGILVIFLVFWLSFTAIRMAFWSSRRDRYRAAGGNGPYGRPGGFDPAIRTARLRYARGEITREQYDQIVQGLRPGPPTP
ncbi:MAG: hypothetical protein ACLQD8_04585 [Thermoplasmata archaeon]